MPTDTLISLSWKKNNQHHINITNLSVHGMFYRKDIQQLFIAHRNMVHNRIGAANWQRSENLGEQTISIAPGTGLGITVNALFPRKMSWDSHCLSYFSNYWISISCKIHTVKFQLLLQGLCTTGKRGGNLSFMKVNNTAAALQLTSQSSLEELSSCDTKQASQEMHFCGPLPQRAADLLVVLRSCAQHKGSQGTHSRAHGGFLGTADQVICCVNGCVFCCSPDL